MASDIATTTHFPDYDGPNHSDIATTDEHTTIHITTGLHAEDTHIAAAPKLPANKTTANVMGGTAETHDLPPADVRYNRLTTIRLLQSAAQHPIVPDSLQLHIDGGANRSITPNRDALLHYRDIKPIHICGVNADDPAVTCNGFGYLPWRAPDGYTLLVRCYYSSAAADTIISPSDVVLNHLALFKAWHQYSDMHLGTGYIDFIRVNTDEPALRFPLTSSNGLWYYYNDTALDYNPNQEDVQYRAIVNRLNATGIYELQHARLGHPGTSVMTSIHKHVVGIPKLSVPPLFRCDTCLRTKATKRAALVNMQTTRGNILSETPPQAIEPIATTTAVPGAHFHMDMGFVRGTGYSTTTTEGKLITSLDGYNSYVIIVDRATRYTWIILTKAKTPQVEMISKFLTVHGNKQEVHRTIRTDQGGELWKSHQFQRMCTDNNFLIEPTASDASFQNGMAERPNRTYGDMMRSLLHGAHLGPEYWSWALLHAVYLKNRLPHRAIGITPYQAYTGKRPNLAHLRIFGSPIVSRLPGRRPAKLDHHTSVGIFLGYTATAKNIYYRDRDTKRVKIATHVTFDEAGYTRPSANRTHIQCTLQRHGHNSFHEDEHQTSSDYQAQSTKSDISKVDNILQVQLLTPNAMLPTRDTPDSAGLDVYSAESVTLAPGIPSAISTDIAVCPPPGTYCHILSRSGPMAHHNIETKAGVVDRDYPGNVKVVLVNNSTAPYQVNKGDKIAQLLIYHIAQSTPVQTTTLNNTLGGPVGFGSTNSTPQPGKELTVGDTHTTPTDDTPPCLVPVHHIRQVEAITEAILTSDGIEPYNIWLSTDPFNHKLKLAVEVKGTHPTLGLSVKQCPITHRVQLVDMAPGTPGARLPRWRSTIKRSIILSIDGEPIHREEDVAHAILHSRRSGKLYAMIEFATATGITHHPTEGSLHLFYDQLNVIAAHLRQYSSMATGHQGTSQQAPHAMPNKTPITAHITAPSEEPARAPSRAYNATDEGPATVHSAQAVDPDLGQAFTWRQIKQRPDLAEWKTKRYKMLDDYHQQGMFSAPMKKPKNANVHHMLWRYLIKQDGTKKARMVCDGSPRQGTITLGHTYANSLMAASERMFWALVATHNLVAYGADVTNAFAEAPPPVHPLFLYIDDAFKEWWTDHLGHPPIPPELTVVQVQNAIQGHPESPRLWEKHIDKILRSIGFKPTRHEPCLYRATINGHMVLFLRQVDDFAIAATAGNIVDTLLHKINDQLRMPMKNLGVITRFNGIDVDQTRHYVKLHCKTYLSTMLHKKEWLKQDTLPVAHPTPFHTDRTTLRHLQDSTPPTTELDKLKLQDKMGFSYRQLMGEIMYPMVKCRPDISPHTIFLSQYMDNPSEQQYRALREIAIYLSSTLTDGIHYWRKQPILSLPNTSLPTCHHDNHILTTRGGTDSLNLIGYVDSDWAANIKKRTSLTGAVIMLAGGVIGYKTKFQTVIAHSSTEAEFVAACDTAKMILFFRSLLDELDLPQHSATILYEDNTGALLMANAQQPTRRTRHMDIKHFTLLDWVEQDLLQLQQISTHDNAADAMTKPLTRQLFYRHRDTYMGYRIPDYVRSNQE